LERRQFLQRSALAGAVLAFSGNRVFPASSDAFVEILPGESMGEISPLIYGHFTEHIGGVIYDGVWVGENSKIPNRGGIRSEIVDMMKKIHVPMIRWPGGCFADSYNWRDGIGPRSQRPRRTNFWEVDSDAKRLKETGKQIFETNEFGTNEFMRFCKLTGAEPYVAANVRSLPALEFDNWVEYCNSPAGSTTLAEMRAANGSPEPFNVRYWGVGNESWGCGGFFTPEEYASEFRRYSTWIPLYGLDLQLVGAGPNGNDIDWTHRFFEQIFSGQHPFRKASFTGWSVHHYASGRSAEALDFEAGDWYDILSQCNQVERIIQDHWAAMGQYDKHHRVKLVVDEYGPWYSEGTELDPTHIFGQQITVRDALATALTLDAFNRHPEKVSIATCAQLVNNINALFLCHEDRFFATPNYHVFDMYAAHQGAQSLRVEFSAPSVHYEYSGKSGRLWGLNGSASRKGDTVTITMVNSDLAGPKQTHLALRGMRIKQGKGTVLAAANMHAHNTFDRPNEVHPVSLKVELSGDLLNVNIPPASVTKIEITVG
jgi:alpha-L-arabinofuranosidase